MNTNFIYFSSGNEVLHRRTILSVLSILNNYPLKTNESIIIHTDAPHYFEPFLEGLPVDYQLLTQTHIKQMMGEDDLIHRVKIGIIERSMQLYPTHKIFYVDSDTFFFKPFASILEQVTPENSVMHKKEYNMATLGAYPPEDSNGFRKVYDLITQNTFVIENEPLQIDIQQYDSWNAGIIGLHPENFHWLRDVYTLTDQLYAPTRNHACEQYAFSYILQKRSNLIDCEAYNRHYWHRIEKKIADERLEKWFNQSFAQLPLQKKKEKALKFCRYLFKVFPIHPYTHRYNAMIAFQERKFLTGYKETFLTLLRNPLQDVTFFKDVAYHTKKMLLRT
ncbi:MAG: hypothetical protein ACFB0B_14280 [Thermonemataceae bacterium]